MNLGEILTNAFPNASIIEKNYYCLTPEDLKKIIFDLRDCPQFEDCDLHIANTFQFVINGELKCADPRMWAGETKYGGSVYLMSISAHRLSNYPNSEPSKAFGVMIRCWSDKRLIEHVPEISFGRLIL